MGEIAIQVEQLGKEYRIGSREKYRALRDTLTDWLNAPARAVAALARGQRAATAATPSDPKSFWALKDVSFEVKRGEVIGIIGRNGAGKSTLLKILSRVTRPTEGHARIHGRVGSLLEVGTGFHPELTGRENLYLNGTILGMKRREITRKFDEIVAFSEIEKFIDTPVKRYSSGMYTRLAFAVAAHLEPEILMVDEVLAVGDVAFQKKCLGKMGEVAKEGRTVLFVSHNMGTINQLCSSSLWIDAGSIKARGDSRRISEDYLANAYKNTALRLFDAKEKAKGYVARVCLYDENYRETSEFQGAQEPIVEIHFVLNERVRGCHIACIVTNSDGYHLFSTADTDCDPMLLSEDRSPGTYVVRLQLPTRMLNTGTYHIAVGIGIPRVESFDRQDAVSFTIHDTGDFGTMKEGGRRAGLMLMEVPWKYQNDRNTPC